MTGPQPSTNTSALTPLKIFPQKNLFNFSSSEVINEGFGVG